MCGDSHDATINKACAKKVRVVACNKFACRRGGQMTCTLNGLEPIIEQALEESIMAGAWSLTNIKKYSLFIFKRQTV